MFVLASLGALIAAIVSYFWNQSTAATATVDSFFTSVEFQSAVAEAKERNVGFSINEDTFTLSKSVNSDGGISFLMMKQNYQIKSEEDKRRILEAIRSFGKPRSEVGQPQTVQLQEYQ